MEFKINRYLTG